MRTYLFPFSSVKRDSRIIIYGAGAVGQAYLYQVRLTKFCEIICMIDRNFSRYTGLSVNVLPVDALKKISYDAIVIANESPSVSREVIELLKEKFFVPDNKIVYERNYVLPVPVISDTQNFIPEEELAFQMRGKFAIAIKLNGGFGDYIIRKNNIREVSEWNHDILLDIYVNNGKLDFSSTLFGDIANINRIIDTNAEYHAKMEKYLAAFYFDNMLLVDFINESALLDIPPDLREKLRQVKNAYMQYGIESGGILYSLHYARCEKDGLNCYTSYNRYGAFHVNESKTSIPLDIKFESEFMELNLKNYITLNYGWDKSAGSENVSAKVWPLEYFKRLAALIHNEFSNVKLVQIGMKDSPIIDCCDDYILGKNIELIKYVLRGANLHIDSEGGMTHLATQLGTKCVVMFGPTPINYYGYESNMNLVSDVCSNCCWFVPDYISCYRNLKKPDCMYSISPERVMEAVRSCLSEIVLE